MRPHTVFLALLVLTACGDDSETSTQGSGSTGQGGASGSSGATSGSTSGSSTSASGSSSGETSTSATSTATSGGGGEGGSGDGGAGDGGAGGEGGVLGFGGAGGAPECSDALCPEQGIDCGAGCALGTSCGAFVCDSGEEALLLDFGRHGIAIPPIQQAEPGCADECPAALLTLKLSLNTGDSGDGGCVAWSTPYGVRVEIVKTEGGLPPAACPSADATRCDEGHAYAADEQSFAIVSVVEPADFERVVLLEHQIGDCAGIVAPDCDAAGCNGTGG